MKLKHFTPKDKLFPPSLRTIPAPPQEIYWLGPSPQNITTRPRVAIVGARKASGYGRAVTAGLAEELARLGLVIISGLALGIDSVAHASALTAGGTTVAVLPTGLDKVYPVSHTYLARQILERGGALMSEYGPMFQPRPENFIARNRLIAGLAQGLIITEAAINSGSLHTARFALEQGKTVMAVPGNITSPLSVGTNNLIKAGALPVTSAADVMAALDLATPQPESVLASAKSAAERTILELLERGLAEGEELLKASGLNADAFNQTLTILELNGRVRPLGANQWSLR